VNGYQLKRIDRTAASGRVAPEVSPENPIPIERDGAGRAAAHLQGENFA